MHTNLFLIKLPVIFEYVYRVGSIPVFSNERTESDSPWYSIKLPSRTPSVNNQAEFDSHIKCELLTQKLELGVFNKQAQDILNTKDSLLKNFMPILCIFKGKQSAQNKNDFVYKSIYCTHRKPQLSLFPGTQKEIKKGKSRDIVPLITPRAMGASLIHHQL